MTAPWGDQVRRYVEETLDRMSMTAAGAAGSVQAVATDRLSATVVVDGSTVGVPVKVAGHVWPLPEDRVALLRIGPRRKPGEDFPGEEWCVVGVTSRIVGPNIAVGNFALTTATNTSASVVNLPGNPSFTFTKRSDTTAVAMYLAFSTWVTVNNAAVGGYLGFTRGGVQTQYLVAEKESGSVAARYGPNDWRQIPDAATPTPLAAGEYVVNLMWARTQGPGTLNTSSSDDHASALVVEMGA